jgi:hypothetical protein
MPEVNTMPPVARRRASLPLEERLSGDAWSKGLAMRIEARKIVE